MQTIGDTVTYLRTVDSTNNYAMAQLHEGLAMHGDAIVAYDQTEGKGQRGKKWVSRPGENLILSIIVEPNLILSKQFALSMAVAISCLNTFKKYFNDEMAIKWPNDIYWNDRKAGGILIENIIREEEWNYAIIGIGLNINQVIFDVEGVQPVSLKQLTGRNFDVNLIAKQLFAFLEMELKSLREYPENVFRRYNQSLYKKDQVVLLKHGSIISRSTITGVSPWGELLTFSGMENRYKVGEVEWLAEPEP
ncbi:MAG: biotin--[acetyl-CoA-carboxylase] ligase [Chitinophagaceae bacterium]